MRDRKQRSEIERPVTFGGYLEAPTLRRIAELTFARSMSSVAGSTPKCRSASSSRACNVSIRPLWGLAGLYFAVESCANFSHDRPFT